MMQKLASPFEIGFNPKRLGLVLLLAVSAIFVDAHTASSNEVSHLTTTTVVDGTDSHLVDMDEAFDERLDPIGPHFQPEDGGFGGALLQMVLVLGGVVLLIYLVLNRGLARLLGRSGLGKGTMAILDRIVLEPKKSLYVVRVSNDYFLIGVSENSVGLVARLDEGAFQSNEAGSIPAIQSATASRTYNEEMPG